MADNPTLRASLRRLADRGRAVAERLGARPIEVTVRVRVYSAPVGVHGAAVTSTTNTVLSPRPRVRVPRERDEDHGVLDGPYTDATGRPLALRYEIGPITPPHLGGGYAPDALVPDDAPMRRVTVVLAGEGFPVGGEEFEVVKRDVTRPHRIMLTVQRARQGA